MNEQPTPQSLKDLVESLKRKSPELGEEFDKSDFGYELAHAVIEARRRLGLTQSEVAERAGMTQQQIADIERVKGNPTIRTLRKLCTSLGLSLRIDMPEAS